MVSSISLTLESTPSIFEIKASEAGPGSISTPSSGIRIVPDVERTTLALMSSGFFTVNS
jgi:hypothetical protein